MKQIPVNSDIRLEDDDDISKHRSIYYLDQVIKETNSDTQRFYTS